MPTAYQFTFNKVFAHAMIFFIQSVIYTMGNAVYQDVLLYLDIITIEQTDEVPKLVGYLAGSFFLGKVISDPIWGYARDTLGDKITIAWVTAMLFVSLIFFGLSTNMVLLSISLALIGFNSGMYIPGTAFMNWATPEDRDRLSVVIYVLMGAGMLLGPFVGSTLLDIFPQPKILYAYGSVGVAMLLITGYFLCVFRDIDSGDLIAPSDYKQMEKIEKSRINHANELKVMGQQGLSLNGNDSKGQNRENLNLVESHNYEESEDVEISSIEGTDREGGLFHSRMKIKDMDGLQVMGNDTSTRNLVIIYGVSWMVKLMDWMLISIWVEVKYPSGGLGISSFKVGLMSVFSFPLSSIIILIAYFFLKKGKRTTWLFSCYVIMFVGMILVSLVRNLGFGTNTSMGILIAISSFKDSAYLIMTIQWTILLSKMVPKKLLGQVYGMGYLLGHVLLVIGSLVYPAGLTFFLDDKTIDSYFGSLKITVYFILLGAPLLVCAALTKQISYRMKKDHRLEI